MGILGWIVSALLIGVPLWKILPRAGMPQMLALVSLVPFFGIALLWVIAFRAWPNDNLPARFD